MQLTKSTSPLAMQTFVGSSGTTYLALATPDGGYHVFAEVEAKAAAIDCGADLEVASNTATTRVLWSALFRRRQEDAA